MNRWLLAGLAFVAGLSIVPLCIFAYIDYGRPPAAVSDDAFPMEEAIAHAALHKRIDSEMRTAPMQPTPQVLSAGVAIYREHCSFCHGIPAQKSNYGSIMYPSAPQLWESHRAGVVGVSDDPVGETFWRVKNGIRLTGMPSYKSLLSEEQMWQVSLLLSVADKPLPEEAKDAFSPK